MNIAVETAVDYRRHDDVHNGEFIVHLTTALRVFVLLKEVKKRCPDSTLLPSIQCLRFQFWRRKKISASSKRCSGPWKSSTWYKQGSFDTSIQIPICASALFRYLKEFLLRYHAHTTFVGMHDKHSMKVGEPWCLVVVVEREKEVLIAIGARWWIWFHLNKHYTDCGFETCFTRKNRWLMV